MTSSIPILPLWKRCLPGPARAHSGAAEAGIGHQFEELLVIERPGRRWQTICYLAGRQPEWCSRSVLILCVNPQPPGSRRGIGGAEAESKVAPEKLFWLSLALLSCLTVHPGRPDQRGRHCWRFCQTWSPTTTAVHFRPGQKALTAQRRARAPLRSIR